MDILRLPTALRRSLVAHLTPSRRALTTSSNPAPSDIPTLSSYTTTLPPTPTHLKFSTTFFTRSAPTPLYTTSTFHSLPPSPFPELAFLGRSNVGKSSLLNALLGQPRAKPAHVSNKPGRTRTINGWGVDGGAIWGNKGREPRGPRWIRFPRGGVVVVDLPGYGFARGSKREAEAWGAEVMKFLRGRKQLRRSFVLVDAEHGLKGTDLELMTLLRREGIAFTVVLSKVDKVLYAGSRAPGAERLARKRREVGEMCEGIRRRLDAEAGDGREGRVDVLVCSAEKGLERGGGVRNRIGVEEVRWAVLSAAGIECDEHGRRKGVEGVAIQEDAS